MDSASLFMSWISASVAPPGRHLLIRLSPTFSSAFIWSAQLGSAVMIVSFSCCANSRFDSDAEAVDVKVVVLANLCRVETKLVRGVAVQAVCAGLVALLPLAE